VNEDISINDLEFSDIEDYWAEMDISEVYYERAINGDSAAEFRPNNDERAGATVTTFDPLLLEGIVAPSSAVFADPEISISFNSENRSDEEGIVKGVSTERNLSLIESLFEGSELPGLQVVLRYNGIFGSNDGAFSFRLPESFSWSAVGGMIVTLFVGLLF